MIVIFIKELIVTHLNIYFFYNIVEKNNEIL